MQKVSPIISDNSNIRSSNNNNKKRQESATTAPLATKTMSKTILVCLAALVWQHPQSYGFTGQQIHRVAFRPGHQQQKMKEAKNCLLVKTTPTSLSMIG